MEDVLDLIEYGLPKLEQRRHIPAAQLTDLVARAVWPKGRTPPPWRDWLPAYARDETTHPVPPDVLADLAVGVRLGLASQDLYDSVQQLNA